MIKQIQDVAIEYNIDILHIDILHIQTICELIYWLFKEISYLYLVYQNDSSFPLFPISFDTLLKDIDYLNLYYSKCDNVIRDIICDNFFTPNIIIEKCYFQEFDNKRELIIVCNFYGRQQRYSYEY